MTANATPNPNASPFTPSSLTAAGALMQPGRFPPLPASVAPLAAVNQAQLHVRLTIQHRDISAFDGDPGNGKTTAATLATANSDGVDWRYCVPPQRASTKGMMLALYEVVFGYRSNLAERLAQDALVRRLIEGDLGLVVDEVHHVGVVGMQQLRHLWDMTCIQDRPFPMLIVGCKVRETLSRATEVQERVARWTRFDTVHHPADLATLMAHLHPRLAATTPATIARLNTRFRGSIRGWHQFAKHIDSLPGTATHPTAPLSKDDVRELQTVLGMV